MDAKIQELTEKIYNEASSKAKPKQIALSLRLRHAELERIEADATARAEEIIKSAERRASDLKKKHRVRASPLYGTARRFPQE